MKVMWRVAESREGHSRGKKVAAMAMICSFVGLLSLQSVTGTLTRFAIVELCFLQVEFSGGLETCLWVDNHVERETIAKRAFQMSQGSICSISKLPPSLNGNMLSALGTTRGLCATNVLVFKNYTSVQREGEHTNPQQKAKNKRRTAGGIRALSPTALLTTPYGA